MKFGRPEQEEVSLNLAPLIDVVFLLLIFFMVTASFTQNNSINLALPEADPERTQAQYLTLKISIDDRDQIIIANTQSGPITIARDDDRGLLSSNIEAAITQLKKDKPEDADKAPTILIEADKAASHGRVIQLMDSIAKLGINKIQFAVEPTQ
jgi:biopolymer transport protein ExbD